MALWGLYQEVWPILLLSDLRSLPVHMGRFECGARMVRG